MAILGTISVPAEGAGSILTTWGGATPWTGRSASRGLGAWAADACARAFALLFGAFSSVSAVAALRSGSGSASLWWVDLRVFPPVLAAALGALAALLLLTWALRPVGRRWRHAATASAAAVLGVVALVNTWAFYDAWSRGLISPGIPVPLSVGYAAAFGFTAWRAAIPRQAGEKAGGWWGTAVALVLLMLAFPVLQILFFGTTDYARPSDVAVVFGARVEDSGRPSAALRDRITAAVDLYRRGLTGRLIMSGGVGANGQDEAAVMRARAIEEGVPAPAIATDAKGANTDATVADTVPMLEASGARRVIVVSQFYHLPRIKLAYGAAGVDVQTVPSAWMSDIGHTPVMIMREIPGFWVYWARSVGRQLFG